VAELGINFEDIILLISDGAKYMIKAGKLLKEINNNFLHITCIAHLLHNYALKVKSFFESADKLIASVKYSILKSKDRRNQIVGIPISSNTIITRWGSWLKAIKYYSEYFPMIKKIVNDFEDDGKIVFNAKHAVSNENMHRDLFTIEREYGWI